MKIKDLSDKLKRESLFFIILVIITLIIYGIFIILVGCFNFDNKQDEIIDNINHENQKVYYEETKNKRKVL